jgi:hypothetical protein
MPGFEPCPDQSVASLARLPINNTDPYQIVLSYAKHGERIEVAVDRLLASWLAS